MIIVGERLNSSRVSVRQALEKKDENFLVNEALKQKQAGADILDLNVSALPEKEIELLKWAVPLLQERVDLPLAIDSPHPSAIEVGLSLHRGRALLNSLSLEKNRWEALFPIIKEYRPLIVALCLDETGLPSTPEEALRLAQRISTKLEKEGVDPADVFLDPLVRPLGVDYRAGTLFLLSLRLIKQKLPAFRTIAGISNISFGLPLRSLLNRTLLSLAAEAGLEAAIIDPCDPEVTASLKAAEALCGRDINLKAYLSYARAKKKARGANFPGNAN
jgi:cobalamin-dependent methionine synthase I